MVSAMQGRDALVRRPATALRGARVASGRRGHGRLGEKTIASFTERLGVNYPVLLGKESVAQAYGDVQFLPDTFYIGRDGKIVAHVQGLINRKEIEETVKKALATNAGKQAARLSGTPGSATTAQNEHSRPAESGAL